MCWPQNITPNEVKKAIKKRLSLSWMWFITKSSCISGCDTISLMAHSPISQQLIKTLPWFSPQMTQVLPTLLLWCRTTGGRDLGEGLQRCKCGFICASACVCVAVCLCAHMKSTLTDYRGSHLICSTIHSLLLLIPVHFPFCNLSIYCRVVVVEVVVRSESMIVIWVMLSE